ncbi:hypothetical protein J6590_098923 [Homalodisca vitripennis]|nr:hypothetical protein J6590_098923 [Homalodisca vitripennis]
MEDEIKQFGKCKTTAFSHCISADVSNSRNMTAGVAVIFKRHFGRPSHSDFVNSHLTCQVPDGSATVYGLVTKPKYDTKPTSYDYAQAFAQLQEDLKKRNLKELICSPMGCVRDKISVEDFAAKIVNFQLNTGANVKIVTFEQPTAKRILFNGYSHSEFIKSLQHFISMQYQNRAATYTTPAEISSETGNTTVECKHYMCSNLLESVSAWKDPVTLVTRASHEYNWLQDLTVFPGLPTVENTQDSIPDRVEDITSVVGQSDVSTARWTNNSPAMRDSGPLTDDHTAGGQTINPPTQQASGLPTRQSSDAVDGQTINPVTQQASGLPTRQSRDTVDGQTINPPTQQASGLPTRQSSEAVDGQIINPPTQQASGPRIGQTTDTLHNQDNDASDESSEVRFRFDLFDRIICPSRQKLSCV